MSRRRNEGAARVAAERVRAKYGRGPGSAWSLLPDDVRRDLVLGQAALVLLGQALDQFAPAQALVQDVFEGACEKVGLDAY